MKVDVYTDGGCKPNPGLGAWAYKIYPVSSDPPIPIEDGGLVDGTTNNAMELHAIENALIRCHELAFTEITIYCDSLNTIKWCEGEYKCNTFALQKYVMMIQNYIKAIVAYGGSVKFAHVEAHLSDKYNNAVHMAVTYLLNTPRVTKADYLCKGLNTLAYNITQWRASKEFACPCDIDTVENRDAMLGKLMLVVTEVSEAAEAVRHNDPTNFKEEIADTFIRLLDIVGIMGIDIAQEINDKMLINETRPIKHDKHTSI